MFPDASSDCTEWNIVRFGTPGQACFAKGGKENLVWSLRQPVMQKMKYDKEDALCNTFSAAERRKKMIHTGF